MANSTWQVLLYSSAMGFPQAIHSY